MGFQITFSYIPFLTKRTGILFHCFFSVNQFCMGVFVRHWRTALPTNIALKIVIFGIHSRFHLSENYLKVLCLKNWFDQWDWFEKTYVLKWCPQRRKGGMRRRVDWVPATLQLVVPFHFQLCPVPFHFQVDMDNCPGVCLQNLRLCLHPPITNIVLCGRIASWFPGEEISFFL